MATGVLVSVEEYLRSSYESDCDYLDGAVVERNWGERQHGATQREILFFLATNCPPLRERLLPEQRVQITPTRFRVPDVCVLAADAPDEQIIRTRPNSASRFSPAKTE